VSSEAFKADRTASRRFQSSDWRNVDERADTFCQPRSCFSLNNSDGRSALRLEARRGALMRLVAKRRGDKIVFNEALGEEGAASSTRPRRHRVEAGGQLLSLRQKPQLAEDQEPGFRQE
jgi:hypothetical protein